MLDRLLARWRAHRPLFRAGTPAPVEDVNSPWRHLTRAPLLDRSGGIVGWHLRPIAAGSTNPTALGMAQAALASAARTLTSRGATVITPLPAGPLERGPLAQLGGGCIVEVSDAHLALFKTGLAATVAALRARDIEIATAQRAIALLVPPDWIVIDARGRSAAAALGEYRQFMLKRRWVALGLRSLAQVHAALGAGASLASGTFEVSARALQADQSEPGPSFVHAASLLRAVLEGKSVRALATLAAADPATAYRVLRATNGSIHQWGYERGSLQDALRTWDAQERFRRACALVLTAANERPYVRALQEVALTRARLFEWIALLRKDTGATAPALFATGAFSLLGPILDLPQPRVLTQVSLPEAGRATLLEEEGPWRSYLDLAAALESAEVHAIESAARALGLDVRRALELHGAAAEWAADVTAEMSDLPAVARRRARA